MASDYRISKVGHNQALGTLTVLSPQPHSDGVQATSRDHAVSGTFTEQGLFIPLLYEMVDTATKLTAILTTYGLNNADTNEVTGHFPRYGVYARWNGLAILPEVGRDLRRPRYFYQPLIILVINLALST